MPIATGVNKILALKKETTYGTLAGATGGAQLRRVTSTIDLTKDGYQSAEIAQHQQVNDFRHGVRRVSGQINGELAPNAFTLPFQSLLRRDFAAVTAISGASITIAGTGPTYTVTRAAGSFLTDGVKIGDVIRLTAGSFNANNLNKNLLVSALTATVATVLVLNGSTLTAEGPIASATVSLPGKKTFTPSTGQTDDSYTIEHWFPDVPTSEQFSGCKFAQAQVTLPPTGLATVNFTVAGQNMTNTTTQYFTSPTAVNTTAPLAGVNGVLLQGGSAIALITSADFSIAGNFSGDPVVGSTLVPGQFQGRLVVTGNLSAYFDNTTLRDVFRDETETSLSIALTTANTAAADFMVFSLPRVKLNSAGKDDGETGLKQSITFQALLNTAGGAGTSTERTTLSIQDSQA